MVQWLRIHHPLQGTWVPSRVGDGTRIRCVMGQLSLRLEKPAPHSEELARRNKDQHSQEKMMIISKNKHEVLVQEDGGRDNSKRQLANFGKRKQMDEGN